ncbi:MAG: phosphoribosylformylglycinamidine synthase subunit PurS [bacterium]|nr:phosphoribosylformylglycinamidine synthase subunit PurS [Candidatus Sumerlaeota bacterium]
MIRAHVNVFLKPDVMDPQGKALGEALLSLGHKTVKRVRVGRYFDIALEGDDPEQARVELTRMCEELLANTVIENYEIRIDPAQKA